MPSPCLVSLRIQDAWERSALRLGGATLTLEILYWLCLGFLELQKRILIIIFEQEEAWLVIHFVRQASGLTSSSCSRLRRLLSMILDHHGFRILAIWIEIFLRLYTIIIFPFIQSWNCLKLAFFLRLVWCVDVGLFNDANVIGAAFKSLWRGWLFKILLTIFLLRIISRISVLHLLIYPCLFQGITRAASSCARLPAVATLVLGRYILSLGVMVVVSSGGLTLIVIRESFTLAGLIRCFNLLFFRLLALTFTRFL